MPQFSPVTQSSFSVTPQQIPKAPTFGAITQLPTPPGSVSAVVNVPTLDITNVALTAGNEVKFLTLFWSENAIPGGITASQLYASPANVIFRNRQPVPLLTSTITFQMDGLIAGQSIFLAASAEN